MKNNKESGIKNLYDCSIIYASNIYKQLKQQWQIHYHIFLKKSPPIDKSWKNRKRLQDKSDWYAQQDKTFAEL